MNTTQRLLSNTFLSFVSNTIAKVSSSVLFILVGRQIGPTSAGVFNLGITYFTIIVALSALGLQELLVREVAPRKEHSKRYLTNYLFLRVVTTLITYAVLLLALRFLLPYSPETNRVIGIITLSVFPESLFALCQAFFEAHERLRPPAFASVVSSGLRLLGGWWVLQTGQDPILIAWLIPVGGLVRLLLILPALPPLLRSVAQTSGSALDFRFMREQLRYTPSFMVIYFFSIVDYQTDTFLISIMLSETAVGWYGAAQTILLGFWIMPAAIRAALYPVMARYYVHAPDKLLTLYEKSWQYLLIGVLPMVVGVFLLAQPIVLLIFDDSFAPAVPVLQWSIWGVIFVFLNVPNARLLLVHNRQRMASWMTGLSMATNVGLNLLLIPIFGIVGAAVSRLLASFVLFTFLHLYVHRYLAPDVQLWRHLPRPILATGIMALAVLPLRELPLIWPVLAGTAVFIVAALALGVVPPQDRVYWRQVLKGVEHAK
jgi:O-antigen/teichoic acid export membrane protein